MIALRSSLVWLIFNFLWTLTRADITVSCQLKESCILPCMFNPGDEPVIHWLLGETKVHSYYHNQDQLNLQSGSFKGRTSLFKDQISKGNASLLLKGLQIKDHGKYKCYTSTMTGHQDSFINLVVNVPVREVDIKKAEDTITCISKDIFPKPELEWSTDPPSSIDDMNPTTEVLQTEQQLYSIHSSLSLSDSDASLNFSCTVHTPTSKKKATLLETSSISVLGTETIISCTASETDYTYLIWRFNNNQLILKHSKTENYSPSKEWEKHVENLSESGRLTLKDLSPGQQGMYTCELEKSDNIYIKNTMLHIQERQTQPGHVATGVSVFVVLLLGVIVGVGCHLCKKKKNDMARVPATEPVS